MTGSQFTHELATDCIYTALIQLMQHKDYENISITEITRKAGVSRMAYYRNYESKDEILIKHLKKGMDDFYEELKKRKGLSKVSLFQKMFENTIQESALSYIIQAGLTNTLFDIHKVFMRKIYTEIFEIDLSIPENAMEMYADMGCVEGMIMYCIEKNDGTCAPALTNYLLTRINTHDCS
ncbi:MAG: TetR/AcrR family transcriptional regulator [Clostridiales bacterium]|nr:TetR/AcrR family transcriptional regulator [Clostridiales bacterium]